jgi:hypothetical protein
MSTNKSAKGTPKRWARWISRSVSGVGFGRAGALGQRRHWGDQSSAHFSPDAGRAEITKFANKIVILTGAGGESIPYIDFSSFGNVADRRLEPGSRRGRSDCGEYSQHTRSGDRGYRGTRPCERGTLSRISTRTPQNRLRSVFPPHGSMPRNDDGLVGHRGEVFLRRT